MSSEAISSRIRSEIKFASGGDGTRTIVSDYKCHATRYGVLDPPSANIGQEVDSRRSEWDL